MKESLNEIDSGVLKSQVWFHIALTSADAPPTDMRDDEKLINFYCDICQRGKCGNKQKKSFSCSSSQAFCLCQYSIDFSADFIDSLEYC